MSTIFLTAALLYRQKYSKCFHRLYKRPVAPVVRDLSTRRTNPTAMFRSCLKSAYMALKKTVLSATYPDISLNFIEHFCDIFSRVLKDADRHGVGFAVAEHPSLIKIKGQNTPTLCWKIH